MLILIWYFSLLCHIFSKINKKGGGDEYPLFHLNFDIPIATFFPWYKMSHTGFITFQLLCGAYPETHLLLIHHNLIRRCIYNRGRYITWLAVRYNVTKNASTALISASQTTTSPRLLISRMEQTGIHMSTHTSHSWSQYSTPFLSS